MHRIIDSANDCAVFWCNASTKERMERSYDEIAKSSIIAKHRRSSSQLLHYLSCRLVNNQLSGAWKSQIELIDFLFRPSNCLYRFNSCFIGLAAGFDLRIELIVDNSAVLDVEQTLDYDF